jgi:hypothetical protein
MLPLAIQNGLEYLDYITKIVAFIMGKHIKCILYT